VVWRKGKWSVEGEVYIPSMTLVASDDLPESDRGLSGFWWEAVDRQGQVIYRHMVADPFSGRMEVFDKDARIKRVQHRMHEEVTFDILIPDLPEIAELHFFSNTKPGEEHTMTGGEHPMKRTAERIATLDIRKGQGGDHGRK
jgi:hypothetical protein